MCTLSNPETSVGIGLDAIERILEDYNSYILTLARQAVIRSATRAEVLDMEIDEIAQMTRVKLWQTLQKTRVDNLKAYIRRIAHNEAINRIRQQHKEVIPLPVDEQNEVSQEYTPLSQSESILDPVTIFEQKEAVAECTRKLITLVIQLPHRQQQAMICSLKERHDDPASLARSFKLAGKEIASYNWPGDKVDENRLRASLSFTRKRLRRYFVVA
jgi:RNA polymerase sigma factor (sigma-70 family)